MFQTGVKIHFSAKKVFVGWRHFNEIYPQIFLLTRLEKGKTRQGKAGNPKSRNPETGIRKPETRNRNPESGIRNPESGIENDDRKIHFSNV